MSNLKCLLCSLCAMLFVVVSYAAAPTDTIYAKDFGITPNAFEDVVPAMQKAIAACKQKEKAVLVFQEGRYDFWPTHATVKEYYISNTSSQEELSQKKYVIGLLLEQLNNLVIDGNNSLFVFHGKMTCFVFDHCRNISLKNVRMDFERPTMSEFAIKEIQPDHLLAAVSPASTFTVRDKKIYWYGEGWGMKNYHAIISNPSTGINRYSSWTPFQQSEAVQTGPREVRFNGDFSKFKGNAGDVISVRDPIRDQVGGWINHSGNIQLENVSMYYMHGLGIVSQFSENISFRHFSTVPPDSSRQMSCFADALHFSGCKGSIVIEDSHFKGLHDDPINVHGTHLKIVEKKSPTDILVAFMHPQSYGFEAFFPGDTVSLVHPKTLEYFGENVVASASLVSPNEMILHFNKALPEQTTVGDCLENITWTASLTVRNSVFESVHTRGILVTTRKKVVIEDNLFYRTGMHAILIANDALGWYESGPVQDVLIRNNRFEECAYNSAPGNFAIAIAPENHELKKGYFVHRNIRIENNQFKVYDPPVLTAKSVNGLTFTNNKIVQTHVLPGDTTKVSFVIDACKQVRLQNNTFETDWKPKLLMMHADKNGLKAESDIYVVTQ
ncbi:right-handed parallel beta-helix repeat-containing protein [Pinibacter aurantiacus]|uniref:Right-handed parallel beta-helix repeat-containing protein n=1 Tax=Pinibacter aurantiacus TaxID=2851599 RepID=A0A9E2W7Y7_9BACT|nr:right-handed parallel beta-helix repeat-containing protein [Pinibacter aurantiacus]MBV4357496.1 right-handed parallel beta-helix repeat-containing protein [Pinibacter aurantiacus]